MFRSGIGISWIVVSVCAVVLISFRVMLMTTQSIDVTAHISLENYIARNLSFPHWHRFGVTPVIPTLSIMTFYAPISHACAAALALLLGSDVEGLNGCALLAVYSFYSLIFYSLVRYGYSFSALLLIAVILTFGHLDVFHGGELVENFFYAQVFGSALMLICLYLSIMVLDGWRSIIFALGSAYVLAWTYLMSEVTFCSCFLSALLVQTAWSTWEGDPSRNGTVIKLFVSAVAMSAITVLHPEFEVMRAIAMNNAGINPRLPVYIIGTAAATELVLAIVIWAAIRRQDRRLAIFVISLTAGTALAFYLQYAVGFFSSLGSDYALRKYTFDVFTTLAIATSFGIGACLPKVVRVPTVNIQLASSLSAVAALSVVLYMYSEKPSYDIKRFAEFNRRMANFVDYVLPEGSSGQTVSLVNRLTTSLALNVTLNLSASIIDFHVPFTDAYNAVDLHNFDKIHFAVVSSDDPLAAEPSCHRSRTISEVVAVDLGCAVVSQSIAMYNKPLIVQPGAIQPPYLVSGWSDTDATGSWSVADTTSLRFKVLSLPPRDKYILTLVFSRAFELSEMHPVQSVVVAVGGKDIGSAEWRRGTLLAPLNFEFPAQAFKGDTLEVALRFPNSISPQQINGSSDIRKFGLELSSFTVGE